MAAAKLWWERIFGPERTLERLAQSYQQNARAVVFLIPSYVPYLPDLRELVKHEWRVRNSDSALEIIEFDCSDTTEDFDEALLEKLAPQGIPLRRQGVSLAEFIRNEGLLSGRALWITGVNASTYEPTFRLAQSYFRYKNPKDGFILLELKSSFRPATLSERNEVLLSIGETDIETYSTDLFRKRYAEERVQPCVYRYLSFLTSSLCGTDAELTELFAMKFDYRKNDPAEVLRGIMESDILPAERGTEVCEGEEAHPFFLIRKGKTEEIKMRIWRAQIRAIFPVLEDIRWALINRYRDFWSACLQQSMVYDETPQERKRILSPNELELAQLNYCLHTMEDASSVNQTDYNNIAFLPEQRNRLAHLLPLEFTAVDRVFKIAEQYGIK